MFGIMPLRPAYGRDYRSKSAVLVDWYEGKDFQTSVGQYCSARDFEPGTEITVRYSRLQKVMIFASKGVSS